MVDRKKITSFVAQVAQRFQPERVVLFGSYASGMAGTDSDVDLLVIMPHKGHPAVAAAEILKRIRAGFPIDLIVRSPEAIRKRLAMDDFFITEILERGETLYEAEYAGVGR